MQPVKHPKRLLPALADGFDPSVATDQQLAELHFLPRDDAQAGLVRREFLSAYHAGGSRVIDPARNPPPVLFVDLLGQFQPRTR